MICGYRVPDGKWRHIATALCAIAAKYTWKLGLICYERGICPEV